MGQIMLLKKHLSAGVVPIDDLLIDIQLLFDLLDVAADELEAG